VEHNKATAGPIPPGVAARMRALEAREAVDG